MPYILRHPTRRPIQSTDEPIYDSKYKGWRFDGQLLIDKDSEYTIDEGSLPPPEPEPPPSWKWIIDVPAFFDRFGAAEDDIMANTTRKVESRVAKFSKQWFIDLEDPKVATMLAAIATEVPSLTPELQTEILTTPVKHKENIVARRIFFV